MDLLVRAQVYRARKAAGDDDLRGLSISEEEVDALLERPIGEPPWSSVPASPELTAILADVKRQAAVIERRREQSVRRGIELRLDVLAARFGLDRFAIDALLLALAPEVDARYGRLFAYLHDDVNRPRCSVDLVLSLLCGSIEERSRARARFSPEVPLVRSGLLKLHADPQDREPNLIRCSIKVDNRIVDYLHGIDSLDPALAPWARLVAPRVRLDDLVLDGALRARLARVAERPRDIACIAYLRGSYGAGKSAAVEALCSASGRRVLVVDGNALEGAPDDKLLDVVRLAAREAKLIDAALSVEGIDPILAPERRTLRAALIRAMDGLPGITFLAGEGELEIERPASAPPLLRVELGLPDSDAQIRLWNAALGGGDPARPPPLGQGELELLTSRYRLTAGQIRDAAATARELVRVQNSDGADLSLDILSEACRIHSAPRLTSLANKVAVTSAWDDLVLSRDRLARLHEICDQARYRAVVLDDWGFGRKLSGGKGLSLLFAGPPGTGKTMTAGIIANELGKDLYAIDLSNVVNKYIGETEKNLAKIFDEAERASAVLFFDEADALFGKRSEVKDSHDRFANIETSYLLQRMEAYAGVAILATNLAHNMDEAFVRRVHFIVDFAPPDERERLRIWERIFPPAVPRDPDVDLDLLAERFAITGGSIRNVALAAAYLAAADGAPIAMRHLLHATRREYQKMGKIIDEKIFTARPA